MLKLLEQIDQNNISPVDKECFYQRMGFGRKSPDHCQGDGPRHDHKAAHVDTHDHVSRGDGRVVNGAWWIS